ncbi:MazG nucleotide pyrophosphohydrolase domain-containing protein [Halorussus marinus]|uniref:MazG nucleotide pyrophosphohydrolase domain-containing protein n=1 Tax=Halorussus marinus TaxID=2505976 RepID=UPI00106E717B|nr:MazG-like family protein [Halorussus marinus]
MDAQRQVAAFVDRYDIDAPPAYRLLDLTSELGELAKDANTSTGYGDDPDALALSEDELGDALFALLALAESVGVDADDALGSALAKYEARLDETGDAGSGE